jgi:hypothetical protein
MSRSGNGNVIDDAGAVDDVICDDGEDGDDGDDGDDGVDIVRGSFTT